MQPRAALNAQPWFGDLHGAAAAPQSMWLPSVQCLRYFKHLLNIKNGIFFTKVLICFMLAQGKRLWLQALPGHSRVCAAGAESPQEG